jgi:hypothetical protein
VPDRFLGVGYVTWILGEKVLINFSILCDFTVSGCLKRIHHDLAVDRAMIHALVSFRDLGP